MEQSSPTERMAAASPAERRDLVLLDAIARGDRTAFDALYRGYYARLMDFVLRMVRERDFAEEVVNDTMYAVWTGGAAFAGRSRVSTWIFGIAYRKALKRLERERRLPLESLDDSTEPVADDDPGQEFDAEVLSRRLESALARLSPAHRSVIELTFLLEHSYEEIAEIVGCPVNTVKTRMFHARGHLRRLLGDGSSSKE